eukprot:g44447.t1
MLLHVAPSEASSPLAAPAPLRPPARWLPLLHSGLQPTGCPCSTQDSSPLDAPAPLRPPARWLPLLRLGFRPALHCSPRFFSRTEQISLDRDTGQISGHTAFAAENNAHLSDYAVPYYHYIPPLECLPVPSYTYQVVGNGIKAQSSNPEVKVKGTDPVISQIVDKLKHINQQFRLSVIVGTADAGESEIT